MRKIGKVIASCEDCEFMHRYNDSKSNYGCILVCRQTNSVLAVCDAIGHEYPIGRIEIPADCPLEEYTGNAEIYE